LVPTRRRAGGVVVVCVFRPIALISIEISAIEGLCAAGTLFVVSSVARSAWLGFKRFVWRGCAEQEERESSLSNHNELVLTDWSSCVE
jgi:hypothetical protein